MSESINRDYTEFDRLLKHDGPVILVGHQLLKPASFDETKEIVFPPSYANPSGKKEDPPVYNIDTLDPQDPSKNVCVLDSIPSQANRMEPLFAEPPYDVLVPQYRIRFNDELPVVNITQVGHRIADAAFRGTPLRNDIVKALREYANGNAKAIAQIGPTSLVFGAWDSRGTGIKIPRIINSIIRAFNVQQVKRSAQYTPPIKYEQEGFIPVGLEGKPADHGLADVPSPHVIGGVQVFGEIRRDFALNLELLRELRAPLSKDEIESLHKEYESKTENTTDDVRQNDLQEAMKIAARESDLKLQRYVLGLAILAFTATMKTYLRQGCQLMPKQDPSWKEIYATGKEETWALPANIEELAKHAAEDFGVNQPANQPFEFNKDLLKSSIDADAKKKLEKKSENTGNPIDNLRKLVADLEPIKGDKFSTAKTSKLSRLQEAIADIEADSNASVELKSLAAHLKPLSIADAGAAARKAEMLLLFPTSDQVPKEDAAIGSNPEHQS